MQAQGSEQKEPVPRALASSQRTSRQQCGHLNTWFATMILPFHQSPYLYGTPPCTPFQLVCQIGYGKLPIPLFGVILGEGDRLGPTQHPTEDKTAYVEILWQAIPSRERDIGADTDDEAE